MGKIKKELNDLKQKSEEQQKLLTANDRVGNLEKQLAWFREECLKLYGKLEAKNKGNQMVLILENEQLRLKVEEVEGDKKFL